MVQFEIVPAIKVNPLEHGGLTQGYIARESGLYVVSDNPVLQDFWDKVLNQKESFR